LIDWSNHTLVSFGDSFTFGDGIIPEQYQRDMNHPTYRPFDERRTRQVYTTLVANKLKFKNSINFGLPANNNMHMYEQLFRFVNSEQYKKDKNIFILLNLTSYERVSLPIYGPTLKGFVEQKGISLFNPPSLSHLEILDEKSYHTVFELVFDNAKVYRDNALAILHIKQLLEQHRIPYYIFSAIGTVDLVDAITAIKNNKYEFEDHRLQEFTLNNLDGYEQIYDIYVNEVRNFKHFHYFFNNDKFVTGGVTLDIRNCGLAEAMGKFASLVNKVNYREYYCFEDGHWNPRGHTLAARMLSSLIELEDYSYLGL
jgi:hypothetical protein